MLTNTLILCYNHNAPHKKGEYDNTIALNKGVLGRKTSVGSPPN